MKDKMLQGILSFFIVMVCCTLVARGAASVTVARVKTGTVKKGSLTEAFSGNGEVEAADRYFQSLPEGQKVARVLLSPGSRVRAGETIVQLDMEYLEEQIRGQERELEKLQITLEQQKLQERSDARTSAEVQPYMALEKAQKVYEDALEKWREAEKNCSEPRTETGTNKEAGTDAESNQAADEQERKEVLAAAAAELEAAQQAKEDAETAYQLAVQEEKNIQANEAVRRESVRLSQQGTQIEIEALREKLARLYEIREGEGKVIAEAEGTLESVGAAEGTITAGTEQMVFETGGQRACGVLPKDKIGIVQEGDEMELRMQGSAETVKVQIERLGKNTEGDAIWYAALNQDVYQSGTKFTYQYEKRSEAAYEALVSLSALRESGNAAYVLTAGVREGVLGESYTAVRVPVTVIGKDDRYAAINSALPQKALIIEESSKYVEEGDRVRLEESE